MIGNLPVRRIVAMAFVACAACCVVGSSRLSSSPKIGYGTSVVVLRSPKLLVAVVDSKENYIQYSEGKSVVDARTLCKVARIGPFFGMVAGIANGNNGFDALRIAEQSWQPGVTLAQLASRLSEAIPPQLIPLLESVRDANSTGAALPYWDQAALQLTLLGKDGGIHGEPQVIIAEFIPENVGSDPLRLTTRLSRCPGDCSQPISAYFLGIHRKIDEFLRGNMSFIARPDESRAVALIDLEYADRPDVVGGPISMVRIDRSGAVMVRKGVCRLD